MTPEQNKYQAEVDSEKNACADIARLAEELAQAAYPIANRGDGNCGFIIQTVIESLERAGLYVKDRNKTKNTKAKINGKLRKLVFERDAYRCKFCGSHIDLEVDHIFPESAGGTLDISNLQTLCKICNGKKGAKI